MIVIDGAHEATLTTIVIDPTAPMVANNYFPATGNPHQNDQPRNWPDDFQTQVNPVKLLPSWSFERQDREVAYRNTRFINYTVHNLSFIIYLRFRNLHLRSHLSVQFVQFLVYHPSQLGFDGRRPGHVPSGAPGYGGRGCVSCAPTHSLPIYK